MYPFNWPYVSQDSILYGRQNDFWTYTREKQTNEWRMVVKENAYYKLSNNIELMYVYKDTSLLGDYDTDLTS